MSDYNARTDINAPIKIVVLGGGYSGALAANRLRKRDGLDITLVNPRPHFVERIRLHQFVAGTANPTVDYGSLLGEGIRLVVDKATRIDAPTRTVQLESGDLLDYDYLIYAVGSTGAVPAGVPGARQYAHPIAEFELAERLRATLEELPRGAPVTVVGGGLTGIETSSELAGQGLNVSLVCGGQLAPSLSEPGRRSIAHGLNKLHVAILDAETVTEVRPDAVVLSDGVVRPSGVTIWTAGFGVPGLAHASGLQTDTLGRLVTDETLTSVDDDRIIAAGDAAGMPDQSPRMSCQAASQLGPQAAETVLSRIAGIEPALVDYRFVGSCISVGRGAGTVQLARKDDSALNLYIGGRAAAAIKETVCKSTVFSIRMEARRPGTMFWGKGGKPETIPAGSEPSAPRVGSRA